MPDYPFTFDLLSPDFVPSRYDMHIKRTLTAMRGQFSDQQAYDDIMEEEGDILLYEVYQFERPEVDNELFLGISVLHPGKVGNEFYMTKGHFHQNLETVEIYHCLKGEGRLVMETPEGEWAVESLRPGRVLYVLPRWAHRSVNTSINQNLVVFFVSPGHAGHDYGTIEKQGFRKLVVQRDGGVQVLDNPRWHQ